MQLSTTARKWWSCLHTSGTSIVMTSIILIILLSLQNLWKSLKDSKKKIKIELSKHKMTGRMKYTKNHGKESQPSLSGIGTNSSFLSSSASFSMRISATVRAPGSCSGNKICIFLIYKITLCLKLPRQLHSKLNCRNKQSLKEKRNSF